MADVTLTSDEAAFLAARLRRLCKHLGYQLPKFADDDASLINIAGSVVGALLTNLTQGVASQPVQLAVGRRYRTRNNATAHINDTGVGCFYGDFGPGNQRRRYAPDGRYCGQGAQAVDPWDIVADEDGVPVVQTPTMLEQIRASTEYVSWFPIRPAARPCDLPGAAYGTRALGPGHFDADPARCRNCGGTWSQHDGKGRCPAGVEGKAK